MFNGLMMDLPYGQNNISTLIKFFTPSRNSSDMNRDSDLRSTLDFILAAGEKEYACKFLQRVHETNRRDFRGCLALHLAAEVGSEELVRWLLHEVGVDKHARSYRGENALHFAAASAKDSVQVVELLIKEGVEINESDEWGITPLHIACHSNKEGTAKLLIRHGADINLKTKRHENALYFSICKGSLEIVEYLLSKGADANEDLAFGETALYPACRYQSAEKIRALLEHGANVNVYDHANFTPFSWMHYKHMEAGRVMIRHLAKLQSVGCPISQLDLKIIKVCPKLASFHDDCLKELQRMKSEKVYMSITFFELLIINKRELVKLTKNRLLVQVFYSVLANGLFPMYASDLRYRIKRAEKKRDTFYNCERFLHSIFGSYLPDLVLRKVAMYLHDD